MPQQYPATPPTWTPPSDTKLWPAYDAVSDPVQVSEYGAQSIKDAEEDATALNDELIRKYYGLCNNLAPQISNGSPNVPPWPKVPKANLIFGPDENGWYSMAPSTLPVCAALVPPPRPGSTLDPGPMQAAIDEYQRWHRGMNTAAGETPDNPPIGTEVTDPDGHKWVKTLAGVTPWGRAVEWRRQ